ncbi:MAG TPA: hypothetical protein VJJ22_04515 [Candidatus Paceibacterota bacterium]
MPYSNKERINDVVFERVGFVINDYVKFEFDDLFTKEEILGYIQSHSTYNLVPENKKIEYMKENEKAVDNYLEDGKYKLESMFDIYLLSKA